MKSARPVLHRAAAAATRLDERGVSARRPTVPATNASAQMWARCRRTDSAGAEFYAVRSYNPSMIMRWRSAISARILGAPPFIQPFPGSERALTLAEVQEMQVRLTKAVSTRGTTACRQRHHAGDSRFSDQDGLLPADVMAG